ncbi:MAG TPA: Gfo/Idh/MocA family oxidoreductase [Alphaproteobacteria bacterium]|nr:Gfo/Idh/MocA family oxidoreductase [Alphaproteobacteria bacterium]
MRQIGILGAAGIAPQAMIEPARRRTDVAVRAVASRRPGVAADYAKRHRIPVAYDGYEALLADPEIEIVYNALPPSHHAQWSIAALEAGKHVLCEKPFAMNGAEARAMVAAAEQRGRVLAEAFHDRFHPAFRYVEALRDRGALGAIKTLKAEFSVAVPFDPKNIRHDPAAGGGSLMDLGCYPVHWVRLLAGEEPDIVVAASATRTSLGVDESIIATLRFPSGTFADVTCGMAKGTPFRAFITIQCDNGTVELENPVFAHRGHSIRERLNGGYVQHTVAGRTTYDHQLEAFLAALDGTAPPLTGGADAIGNMTTIDAIYRKAGFERSG